MVDSKFPCFSSTVGGTSNGLLEHQVEHGKTAKLADFGCLQAANFFAQKTNPCLIQLCNTTQVQVTFLGLYFLKKRTKPFCNLSVAENSNPKTP